MRYSIENLNGIKSYYALINVNLILRIFFDHRIQTKIKITVRSAV